MVAGQFMEILNNLAEVIASRRNAPADSSYTASLLQSGRGRIARKFGEEAVELVVASLSEDKKEITAEAADVLYHLLVLLQDAGITLEELSDILKQRQSMTGLEEKASRSNPGDNDHDL